MKAPNHSEFLQGGVRWQDGATLVYELPVERELANFHEQCQPLLQRYGK